MDSRSKKTRLCCQPWVWSVFLSPKRVMLAVATFAIVTSAIVTSTVVGCGSGGPSMSGFAIGSTRIVSVGEVVELRMPLHESGSRQWRVTSYNSLYLSVAGRPRVEVSANGSREMVVTAQARTPGETQIEVTEIVARGTKAEVVRFKVRILK